MEYTIEKLDDLGIIKVTVDGMITLSERKDIFTQAISVLNRNSYSRILFNGCKVTLSPDYTDDDAIELSNYMATFEVPKNTKFVFLSNEILLSQVSLFAITKILNENITIKHFINYENAVKWLVGKMPYEINWEKKGVLVRFWDTFDYNANVNASIDLYKDPRSNYLTYAIWDTSNVTEVSLTEDELMLIARQGKYKSLSVSKIKMAFFAPDKNILSICEQCCAYCQGRQMDWEFMASDSMKSIRIWVDS